MDLICPSGLGFVDGVDLAALGLAIEGWDDDLTPAVDAPPTAPSGDGWGDRVTGAPGRAAARTLVVRGLLVAATPAALPAARDALVRQCAGGSTLPEPRPVALALAPARGTPPDRQWTAYLTGASTLERVGGSRAAAARVALTFVAPDPRSASVSPYSHVLTTTTLHVPVGDVESRPVLDLDGGAWTSIAVLYRQGDGSVPPGYPSDTLTINKPSVSAGTGRIVRIDAEAESVVEIEVATGAVTPRNDWLQGGDFFAIDPAHTVLGVTPGLSLSTGTGAVDVRLRWR
jgi:hypothetical protein